MMTPWTISVLSCHAYYGLDKTNHLARAHASTHTHSHTFIELKLEPASQNYCVPLKIWMYQRKWEWSNQCQNTEKETKAQGRRGERGREDQQRQLWAGRLWDWLHWYGKRLPSSVFIKAALLGFNQLKHAVFILRLSYSGTGGLQTQLAHPSLAWHNLHISHTGFGWSGREGISGWLCPQKSGRCRGRQYQPQVAPDRTRNTTIGELTLLMFNLNWWFLHPSVCRRQDQLSCLLVKIIWAENVVEHGRACLPATYEVLDLIPSTTVNKEANK